MFTIYEDSDNKWHVGESDPNTGEELGSYEFEEFDAMWEALPDLMGQG